MPRKRKYRRTFWAVFDERNTLYPFSIRNTRADAMDHITTGSGRAWLQLLEIGWSVRRIRVESI